MTPQDHQRSSSEGRGGIPKKIAFPDVPLSTILLLQSASPEADDRPQGGCRLPGRSGTLETGSLVESGEEPPSPGQTLQLVIATILEVDAGSDDEVRHRARDEYFACQCVSRHPSGNVHCQASDIVAADFDIPHVCSPLRKTAPTRGAPPRRSQRASIPAVVPQCFGAPVDPTMSVNTTVANTRSRIGIGRTDHAHVTLPRPAH